ncbi:MAG: SAP domain-containing protein [Solirubrobacteraceae bacterium]
MTEEQFENGYWYATELRDFARALGIPSASRLRKDELERAVRHFLRTGEVADLAKRAVGKPGTRDVDVGLTPDLPVRHYTSNNETKDFIRREAQKIDPAFTPKAGTRYLLNRWREEELARGRQITLRRPCPASSGLNKAKRAPLRIDHARYINFISDFMAANRGATRAQAIAAWHAVKEIDAPKTYEAWANRTRGTNDPSGARPQ